MLEAALVGRGNGEFIATTHCGGGGGGKADDMIKGCQGGFGKSWLEQEARWVMWGGDRKVGKMTGLAKRGFLRNSSATPPCASTLLSLRALVSLAFSRRPTLVNSLPILNDVLSMILFVSDSPDLATVVVQ